MEAVSKDLKNDSITAQIIWQGELAIKKFPFGIIIHVNLDFFGLLQQTTNQPHINWVLVLQLSRLSLISNVCVHQNCL